MFQTQTQLVIACIAFFFMMISPLIGYFIGWLTTRKK